MWAEGNLLPQRVFSLVPLQKGREQRGDQAQLRWPWALMQPRLLPETLCRTSSSALCEKSSCQPCTDVNAFLPPALNTSVSLQRVSIAGKGQSWVLWLQGIARVCRPQLLDNSCLRAVSGVLAREFKIAFAELCCKATCKNRTTQHREKDAECHYLNSSADKVSQPVSASHGSTQNISVGFGPTTCHGAKTCAGL